ncbi:MULTISPECIES: flagellar hook capping FlgD N-terminal domain-containing protein [Paenibacillus]|uniref:flagellar hook capping FlgD N-terminal domain-containing protein n=1 Tax=Paenibacillus TaxID=44249 RepID=UPI00295A724B|nr:flagellar hook capping FlgD N-terminal domain-containing protein [Paenibacillus oceani]MDF2658319.1 flagellar hook capping protein [Paenibacillus sp.]
MANVGVSMGTYYYKNAVEKQKTGSSNLGRDDFLKILVAQMSNQDPTQPLQDKEFIAQMAQFTSVEQLTNMAGEMKLLRQSIGFSSSLIGKSISWTHTNASKEQEVKSGTVESIKIKDGKQFAVVDSMDVQLENIVEIKN